MTHPKKKRSEIMSHGVRLLLPNHPDVRNMKRVHKPSNHGHKVWPTTWLMVDYLKSTGIANGKRVLDLACGWGLSGIFCARVLKSRVTWIDGDEDVFPFLKLLADVNSVDTDFISMDLDKVGRRILSETDIVIASDICFCDTLIDPLRRFVNRARKAAVSQVIISDPGRWPFDDLTEIFLNKQGVELMDWKVTRPVDVQGKILKISM
jgi:predicted nicotinamide N-methyase